MKKAKYEDVQTILKSKGIGLSHNTYQRWGAIENCFPKTYEEAIRQLGPLQVVRVGLPAEPDPEGWIQLAFELEFKRFPDVYWSGFEYHVPLIGPFESGLGKLRDPMVIDGDPRQQNGCIWMREDGEVLWGDAHDPRNQPHRVLSLL